jgi:Pyruvate/2-oxoacid:ferredoxin oxidoreductase delta subunit
MKVTRKIIEIDESRCDGCGLCVPSCAEGALQIVDGVVRIVADKYCDGLGACLGECPNDALRVIEREADDFDEEAVHEFLRSRAQAHDHHPAEHETLECGCPVTQIQSSPTPSACERANEPAAQRSARSALSHWPVQIRLVPPTAPFLKGADLLVVADCTPLAYPNFHADFLEGKVVMMGCPKFDEVQEYVEKFGDIFNTADIKSLTVLVMEVPCCQGLPMIIEKGMQVAGRKIPLEKVIISTTGEVLNRQQLVA